MTPTDSSDEIAALRRQLDTLLRAAHENEQKSDRFDRIERRLMAATTLEELVRLLLDDARSDLALDAVELWLIDTDHEMLRALDVQNGTQRRPYLLDGYAPLVALYGGRREPQLVSRAPALLDKAFVQMAAVGHIGSAALLPLLRQGVLIGSLHLGSRDPKRYESSSGTKFLERLAAVAAISVENTLNRERLRQAGLTDALTGLHNRRYFDHRCPIEVSQALRHRYGLGCLFLDVDHFKVVNDSHGHPCGDAVLRQVGAIVQRSLRQGDVAARYGGEEFVVLLPNASQTGVHEVAERIRLGVERAQFRTPAGAALPVTLSVGMAMLALDAPAPASPANDDRASLLLQAADQALYRAKQHGRNRTELA
ncbi:MAG TPA: DUF484 family protein [Burkholderiaceae bacterium]